MPALSNHSGDITITTQVSSTTGGSSYNIESQSGKLTLAGGFIVAGGATGARNLQFFDRGLDRLLVDGLGCFTVDRQGPANPQRL